MMMTNSSDNIFLSTYNHLNDLVDKCINEHKNHKYPEGIICDTRYIAEITHKIHYNVLRDIDALVKDLNNQGRRTFREVAKSEGSLILQGERGEHAKPGPYAKISQRENIEAAKVGGSSENQGEINLKYEFRIIESLYKGEDNTNRSVYQLSPVAFLVLMGRYNDTIVYCLANFFYRVMKEMEFSLDKLLNTNLTKLDEASELVALRDSDNPVNRELFSEYLPKYLALFGERESVVERMSGIKTANKNSFCYATSLDVWKITGKTEHNKITRDIKAMISKLKEDGFDIDAHYLEAYRRLENNRTIKVY